LAALLHGTLVVGVSQTAAFNRGRHLYSAGRPSRWALAHISSSKIFCQGLRSIGSCPLVLHEVWTQNVIYRTFYAASKTVLC